MDDKGCQCGHEHTVVVKQEREEEPPGCSSIFLACACGVPVMTLAVGLVLMLAMTVWGAIFG